MAATLLCIFLSVLCFPYIALSITYTQLHLPPGASGGEALAFETPGGNFYTGVFDGRIIKYEGPANGFVDVHAITSPQWSRSNCLGSTDISKTPICGRPLGLAYNPVTRILYIADAYHGLLSVGPTGGLATPLATSAEGQPFVFLNGLDMDPLTGVLYFTDYSGVYDLRNASKIPQTNDATGRLLKYDPQTRQVTVLMRNLSSPAGVAVTSSGNSVVVSEFYANRTRRFWLRGPRATTSEVFLNSIIHPNNIKRTPTGALLIAAATLQSQSLVPTRFTIDETGRVLEAVSLGVQYGNTEVSEVHPSGINLYVASRFTDFIGIYGP